MCCKRPAPMRFTPFSYFCTCWNVSPSASASVSWVIPSIFRRIRTWLPTCLSTGVATFFSIAWVIAIAWFMLSPNHAYIGCGENVAVGVCCRGLWIAMNGSRVGRGASEQKRTLSPTRRLRVPPEVSCAPLCARYDLARVGTATMGSAALATVRAVQIFDMGASARVTGIELGERQEPRDLIAWPFARAQPVTHD
jgi:hypothetical protein